MTNLRKQMLYGGLEKDVFNQIHPLALRENKKAISVFSLIAVACFVFVAVLALVNQTDIPPAYYFACAMPFILILLINKLLYRKMPKIVDVLAIIFTALLLNAGVFLAYGQSNERTTLLLPFFTIVPLIFCFRPIFLVLVLGGTEIYYLLLMKTVQPEGLFYINMVNTSIFCVLGIVAGCYTMNIKFKKISAEFSNQILIETDPLTGLYNRYKCRKELGRIVAEREPVTVCSLDINGLKKTNDTKGHLAGDELIVGAADCIKQVFGAFGTVYRVGGDEFFVLINQPVDEERLRREFSEKTGAWKGELIHELSVSLGMARLRGDSTESIEDIIFEADSKMYEEKRNYYMSHDRRKKSQS